MKISLNIVWGLIFTALGVIELIKRYQIVFGIPLWALCFLAVAFSNFLRDPAARAIMRIPEKNADRSVKIASIINALAIVVLIISVVLELLRS